ncbi:hypothetical protein CHS0354_033676 [Potamilus streckersoni]|uniref:Uncharacterized protein n=1 Tax=Potamilus streckersoni TaxID=2493646 RepID=A0AAE0S2K1_9BIVA|nr:hypothetical protein CHS0354_033676 [Potamilus streckersoni]
MAALEKQTLTGDDSKNWNLISNEDHFTIKRHRRKRPDETKLNNSPEGFLKTLVSRIYGQTRF